MLDQTRSMGTHAHDFQQRTMDRHLETMYLYMWDLKIFFITIIWLTNKFQGRGQCPATQAMHLPTKV